LCIIEAIKVRAEHGIFGYTESRDRYFEAVAEWMKSRHEWEVERKWLVKTPGVEKGRIIENWRNLPETSCYCCQR